MLMRDPFPYQLALRTPGRCPRSASSRKHNRQSPNFRSTARARPHRWQRRTFRAENFGARLARSIQHVFAMVSSFSLAYAATGFGVSPRNGQPNSRSSASARSSRPAVVTIVMSIPWIFSTLS